MDDLSVLERDTISEVGNISLGSAATALSNILDKGVDITTPKLDVVEHGELQQDYPIPCLSVKVEYTSGLQGSNMLLIKEADAVIISSLMMGESFEGKEGPLNEIELSAVQEAMNQMMGSMATSMSDLFQRPIEISPPVVEPVNLAEEADQLESLSDQGKVVRIEFSMQVEDIIDSIMIVVIPVEFAKNMAADLLGAEPGTASGAEEEAAAPEAVPGDENLAEELTTPDQPIETFPDRGTEAESSLELSDLERDTISEVGNISLGASATALSTILDTMVDITTPQLSILKVSEIQEKYPIPCVLVEVDYISGLQGSNMLLIKQEDAVVIAAIMMGEDHKGKEGPLNEIELSAVQEAMNQMMGSMATSMSELFQRPIEISPPRMDLIDLAEDIHLLEGLSPDQFVVHVEFTIKVEDIIDSVMIQVIPIEFAKEMAGYLLQGYTEPTSYPETGAEVETARPEPEAAQTKPAADIDVEPSAPAPPVRTPEPYKLPASVDLEKLEMVKDIPMDIIVVLGSTKMPLGELFSLNAGGIVDLDCRSNDPVELLANDRLLAKGEVVMINDQLGVRITEIQFEEVIESYGI